MLGGIYTKDEGEILIEGKKVEIKDINSARQNGISIIHQELMLIPHMSVAENIYLGQELDGKFGSVRLSQQLREAQAILDRFGLDIKANQQLGELNIAEQQMIEIVRSISFGARIIVMDEPTSCLLYTSRCV